MKLKKIKTKKEYEKALARFEEIFQAKPKTNESDEADVLSLIIKDYEEHNFVFRTPDPIKAIEYRMEQMGMRKKDLYVILGYKSRVSDILNRTRKLNLNMIRNLHSRLHIPLETLIKQY